MKRNKQLVTVVILSGTLSLGAQALFAQSAPGGAPSGPGTPRQTTPTVPQPGATFPEPGTTIPQQTQPNIPGQPAPGIPQTRPFPGQPTTPSSPQSETIPGQTTPVPGQPGTIPEILDQPGATNRLDRPGTSTERQTPGTGSSLEGERRSIIPPEPRSTVPQPGQSGTTTIPDSSAR
jgi:hypothetical protein